MRIRFDLFPNGAVQFGLGNILVIPPLPYLPYLPYPDTSPTPGPYLPPYPIRTTPGMVGAVRCDILSARFEHNKTAPTNSVKAVRFDYVVVRNGVIKNGSFCWLLVTYATHIFKIPAE